MMSVMIVSGQTNGLSSLSELLSHGNFSQPEFCKNCAEARRLLIDRPFDLIVINAPLSDETGEQFACTAASSLLSSVILIVRNEVYEEISSRVEEFGVFTVGRPLNRQLFWNILKLACAARAKADRLNRETEQLKMKLEDIIIIDRAKCALVEYLHMTEQSAHHFIEKQAMDMRLSRREVAEGILKTYLSQVDF